MNVGKWSFFNSKNHPSSMTSLQTKLLGPCNNWRLSSAQGITIFVVILLVQLLFIHLSYLHSKPLSAFKYMYKEKYTDIANLQISVTDLPNNHILADGTGDIAPPNIKCSDVFPPIRILILKI